MVTAYLRNNRFKHLHIIGAPRSGTTLLLELLRTCYDWDWVPEIETRVVDAPLRRTGLCLTKNPGRGNHVKTILQNRNMWLLYCQRDPRDIICRRHGLAPDKYWANLAQWRSARRELNRIRNHPHLIIINYEQLVTRPDEIQNQINHQIDWLVQTALFSEFQKTASPSSQSLKAMRGLRPIDEAGIGRWCNNLPRVVGQIELHGDITDELIRDGYETDATWLQILDGVTPDLSAGYWPDKTGLSVKLRSRAFIYRDVLKLFIKQVYQKML